MTMPQVSAPCRFQIHYSAEKYSFQIHYSRQIHHKYSRAADSLVSVSASVFVRSIALCFWPCPVYFHRLKLCTVVSPICTLDCRRPYVLSSGMLSSDNIGKTLSSSSYVLPYVLSGMLSSDPRTLENLFYLPTIQYFVLSSSSDHPRI